MKHFGARGASIDLNLLAVFAVVAEAQSFARAAKQLAVQRSSVSRSIAALETALEVQLFSRTTRHVALTAEGAALYARVSPQLAGLRESLGSVAHDDDQPTGTLRLTTSVDFGSQLLPPILAGFLARYPRVSVDLVISNRIVDLVKEGFDAALRPGNTLGEDSTLVARKVLPLEGHLYAAPTYLAAHGTPRTLDDIVDHELVRFRGFPLPRSFPKLTRPPRVSADEMLFVIEAVKNGLGIGMLPSALIGADVMAGRLVRVLGKQVVFTGGLFLVHPPSRHVPRRLTAFRDYFLEHTAGAGR